MVAIVLQTNTKSTTIPNTSFLAGVLFPLSKSTIVIDISIINDMIIALSKRVNGGINMRVKCPDCGIKAPVLSFERKENKDVDLYCGCSNKECLSQFVMTLSFIRRTKQNKRAEAQKKAPLSILNAVYNLNPYQQQDLIDKINQRISPVIPKEYSDVTIDANQ